MVCFHPRLLILAILVLNRVWFLHSSLDMGMFLRRSHFIKIERIIRFRFINFFFSVNIRYLIALSPNMVLIQGRIQDFEMGGGGG